MTALGPWGTSRTKDGPYFFSSTNPGGGGGGLPEAGDRRNILIEFEDAHNEEDAQNGAIVSGFWFPSHGIQEVDGKLYGRPFAPDPKRFPKRLL